jgi:hypothetical protein
MRRRAIGVTLLAGLIVAAAGCIKAPEIVLVDRATALEQQAAGSWRELEEKLARAGASPRPVPLTPAQLQALGIKSASLVDDTELTDADRVDQLLKQRCVGEAREGTLTETKETCRGASDSQTALALIERVNEARQQLWRWMRERRPQASLDDLRREWRALHLKGVVCGGWIQRDDGGWEAKKC